MHEARGPDKASNPGGFYQGQRSRYFSKSGQRSFRGEAQPE
jgi:hypothetical protein